MKISPRYRIEDDDIILLRKFTAWMELVVRHAAIDYMRRQNYRKHETGLDEAPFDKLSYEEPLPESSDEFNLADGKLSEAFSKLNLLRRQILTLIFVEGLSAQEAAGRLNCSVDYIYLKNTAHSKHCAISSWMEVMDVDSRPFSEVLRDAAAAGPDAVEAILSRYMPLISKHSVIGGEMDEDMRQYIIMRIILQSPNFNPDKAE